MGNLGGSQEGRLLAVHLSAFAIFALHCCDRGHNCTVQMIASSVESRSLSDLCVIRRGWRRGRGGR